MRKLLIFATIVLVFAFATQKKVHNHTKDFNPSKLFNLTKLCKHGYFFSNKTKKCEKKKNIIMNILDHLTVQIVLKDLNFLAKNLKLVTKHGVHAKQNMKNMEDI